MKTNLSNYINIYQHMRILFIDQAYEFNKAIPFSLEQNMQPCTCLVGPEIRAY